MMTFQNTGLAILIFGAISANGHAFAPAFNCSAEQLNSAEQMICADKALSQLDRTLNQVYRQALQTESKQPGTHYLKGEQRGWLKGRNECWKSSEPSECVRQLYLSRIATLQASYRLVGDYGTEFYACDGVKAKEIVVTRFKSDTAALVAEFGDSVSVMLKPENQQHYQGRNEKLQYQPEGKIDVQWGYQTAMMHCERQK